MWPLYVIVFVTAVVLTVVVLSFLGPEHSDKMFWIAIQRIRAVLDPHRIILGGDIPDALRENQLLPPTAEYELGARFEESCALGAAAIARQRALHTLIEGTLDG